tara:strand:- start:19528 stop:21492 length:1965 start_codon:yes stop_codon:yes gene_type:complete
MKLFTTFHLNLSFSSIENEEHKDVIERCYWPLLSLCEIEGVRIGIEISGKTIERIHEIDKTWISHLSSLIQDGRVELIGSGYVQMIAPLVPYEVNHWNHVLGLQIYKKYFNKVPTVALINEMAFSSSIIDLLHELGYQSFIMDESNVKLTFKNHPEFESSLPNHGMSPNEREMPVIWSNSFIFQKLQHYAHGDINRETYLNFFDNFDPSQKGIIPFYTNDAECFDFRPGRFNTEARMHQEGEWNRIKSLMIFISENRNVTWHTPTDITKEIRKVKKRSASLVSLANPVPVKKQPKYNISRWAVSGRNDTWLNTSCFKLYKKINNSSLFRDDKALWKSLCDLWSSDLRTHITEKRWKMAIKDLNLLANRLEINLDEDLDSRKKIDQGYDLDTFKGDRLKIITDRERTNLSVYSDHIEADLNLRKGLTIKSLRFNKYNKSIFGTLPHGYFDSILLGADFFSGGVQGQGFFEEKKITDLAPVLPTIFQNNGYVCFETLHKTPLGEMNKILSISLEQPEIKIGYEFTNWKRDKYFLRVGYITLFPEFWGREIEIAYNSGGNITETLPINIDFDHTQSISNIVSSTTGIPVTDGKLDVSNKEASIRISWDQAQCAVLPMMMHKRDKKGCLTRVLFSIQELDDTLKPAGNIPSFEFTISA